MYWTKIQELCKDKSTTPTAMVKELNLSTSMVTRWKQGHIPNGVTLQKIANYFDVTIDYLLGKETAPEPVIPTEELTEQEKTLLRLFRETTEEGRMRMIQVIFNIYDDIEKRSASGGDSSLA